MTIVRIEKHFKTLIIMALEIQTQVVLLKDSFQPFTFSGNVGAYVAGIASVNLEFSGNDHHIQTIEVALTTNKNGHQVNAVPSVVFKDNGDNSYDPNTSYVGVVVAAWVGDDADKNAALLNWGKAISSGGQSDQINIGRDPFNTFGVLSGFNVSYGSGGTDHHVREINCKVGAAANGKEVRLSAVVNMHDDSGNNAQSPTADVGLLAALKEDPGFSIQIVNGPVRGHQVTFDKPIKKDTKGNYMVGAFITSFDTAFNDDHHVKRFSAFSQCYSERWGHDYSAGGKGTGLWAFSEMTDTSNHTSPTENLSVIVVAVH